MIYDSAPNPRYADILKEGNGNLREVEELNLYKTYNNIKYYKDSFLKLNTSKISVDFIFI